MLGCVACAFVFVKPCSLYMSTVHQPWSNVKWCSNGFKLLIIPTMFRQHLRTPYSPVNKGLYAHMRFWWATWICLSVLLWLGLTCRMNNGVRYGQMTAMIVFRTKSQQGWVIYQDINRSWSQLFSYLYYLKLNNLWWRIILKTNQTLLKKSQNRVLSPSATSLM